MIRNITTIIGAALILASCNANDASINTVKDAGIYSSQDQMDMAPMPTSIQAERLQGKMMADGLSSSAPASPIETDNPSSQSYLAYRYNYGFALPAKSVAETSKSHIKLCQQAGQDRCQVLNSTLNSANADYISAHISFRADPSWLKEFNVQIQESVKQAKGEMTSSSVKATDLTRQIIDTDARLRAQTTLRARLEGLLKTRNAKLSDLLALERELARVQSQIESATTTLSALEKRVTMSVVDIQYQSRQPAVSRNVLSPIGNALKGFAGTFSHALAGVIGFFAHILPWLVFVIAPAIWVLRWLWRRRKLKKDMAISTPKAPTPNKPRKKVSKPHKAANS